MALVIQVGEDEDIPEAPPQFPRCGSWPPPNAQRYKSGVAAVMSGVAAVMPGSESDAMSDSNNTNVSHFVSSTTTAGINLGSLTILLAVLLALVSSATIGLFTYIYRVRKNMDKDILETTHLLQHEQTQI